MAGRRKANTAKAKRTFLEELAKAKSLEHAARAAGVTRRAFYDLRFDSEGRLTDFGREVADAIEAGTDRLEDALLDLGVTGDEVHIYDRAGNLLRTERKRNVAAIIVLLKARRPEKFRDNYRVEHTGADGAPLEVKLTFQPDPALAERLREH